MHLFVFEPGDGVSYRVLFGRLASSTPLIPFYVVFGIAEGSAEPGVWYAFDTEQIGERTFRRHTDLFATLRTDAYWTAWRLWLALTGQADDPDAAARLPDWRDDWRKQIPPAAMG